MHHLAFEARSKRHFEEQFPTIDLNEQLRGFGVCPHCMYSNQGERRRVIFPVNRLSEINKPPASTIH